MVSNFSTLPDRRKLEHIYDIPVVPEMPIHVRDFYSTMPTKCTQSGKEHYDIPPTYVHPATAPDRCLYDIPKGFTEAQQREDCTPLKEECIYDVPPSIRQREPILNGLTLPNLKFIKPSDSENLCKPLDYRCKPVPRPDLPHGRLSWGRKIMFSRKLQEKGAITIENDIKNGSRVSVSENQRNSTVSNSSSSSTSSSTSRNSCDSLMFGSHSPEPLQEVTLSPEKAGQKLLQLQETVFQAVPKLMDFVSSGWRSRKHLAQHLQEIRAASEDVANSVTSFLNFALDIRGNAQQLTDSNLRARLQKQFSIVEDSGLILQTSVNALGDLGWPLDVLVQDLGQPQTPDQLERFVMVARTLPDDMKRLVSIINANSKLLFRNSEMRKETEMAKDISSPQVRKSFGKNEPSLDTDGEEDYVQLQVKKHFLKCFSIGFECLWSLSIKSRSISVEIEICTFFFFFCCHRYHRPRQNLKSNSKMKKKAT